jgi:3-oxoacyl-[acyl-carrier protein] reductase
VFDLKGRVAIVTGGNGGIGLGMARGLATAGARIIVAGRDQKKSSAAVDDLKGRGAEAHAVAVDVTDEHAVGRMVDETMGRWGRLDILVNNAGVFAGGPVEEATVDQADHLWAVDVRAVFVASQAAVRHMGEGGRIITIGSALADRVPVPGMTLYAMAKSALVGLTRGLARDLGPRGITVALVHGGLIDTGMNPADGPAASFLSSIPALGRYGGAEDVAAVVAHLAGEGGRYVTGAAIPVDGGFAA